MRGKVNCLGLLLSGSRITPAYAGKRATKEMEGLLIKGSPPHMRGKVRVLPESTPQTGITPAYAGKSKRGGSRAKTRLGSPPHMRGKGIVPCIQRRFVGITPAYAGKSFASSSILVAHWDHPRICGEKEMSSISCNLDSGSPPHMRGKVLSAVGSRDHLGITPAYAGKRRAEYGSASGYQDHPRICGEKITHSPKRRCRIGSPPHMRGKGLRGFCVFVLYRITPAYAGKRD